MIVDVNQSERMPDEQINHKPADDAREKLSYNKTCGDVLSTASVSGFILTLLFSKLFLGVSPSS